MSDEYQVERDAFQTLISGVSTWGAPTASVEYHVYDRETGREVGSVIAHDDESAGKEIEASRWHRRRDADGNDVSLTVTDEPSAAQAPRPQSKRPQPTTRDPDALAPPDPLERASNLAADQGLNATTPLGDAYASGLGSDAPRAFGRASTRGWQRLSATSAGTKLVALFAALFFGLAGPCGVARALVFSLQWSLLAGVSLGLLPWATKWMVSGDLPEMPWLRRGFRWLRNLFLGYMTFVFFMALMGNVYRAVR